MPTFTVLRRVDAYVEYTTEIEATNARQAARLASRSADAYEWQDAGVMEFDVRGYVTLDADGGEIEATRLDDC